MLDALADTDLLLALAMFLGAALYSSVGHAGASAYLALMALFGVAPATMRPTALVLNVLVASLASWRYVRAGLFRLRVLWPFLAGAMPMAFFGGTIVLPGEVYKPLVGAVLLLSAARLLWPATLRAEREVRDPPVALAILLGAGIGFLSGLTGTGGGIFLSPLLLFLAWSPPKPQLGIASVFILCNSAAGLLGNYTALRDLPDALPLYAAAVLAGALAGTSLGIAARAPVILKALGVVLIVAGTKLLEVY